MTLPCPVLLHIPHSSLVIPDDIRDSFLLNHDELETELLKMTDRYTEELFQLKGADRAVFPISRLVVDPERFRDDTDEPMAAKGMAAVYTKTHDGRPLKIVEDRKALIDRYYDPHHALLDRWGISSLATHNAALLIDCHSYPSSPIPCDLDQTADRPDACIGADNYHTPNWLRDVALTALKAEGWTVQLNRPYAGTMVPNVIYRRDPRFTSVMIELNRALYMNESTGNRLPGFEKIKGSVQRALSKISSTSHS